jgi:RNA polymerase-binding transcription factor
MKRRTTNDRRALMRATFEQLRDEAYAKIVRLRQDQREESQPGPGDEMDVACSSTDMERSASLIERSEDRIHMIDQALARIDGGTYGICEECGDEIPIERLRALPFAALCVDCQSKRRESRSPREQSTVEFWDQPAASRDRSEEHSRYGADSKRGDSAAYSDPASGREEPTAETSKPGRRPRRRRKFRA